MSLILLNLRTKQQIKLNGLTPFIIGRGNIEGCHDKRVSRNHGKLTCTVDGKVRVQALHCNPCYFARNGVRPVDMLNKNEEQILNEGDYLGLLPDSFWFKVSKEEKIKSENQNNNIKTKISSNVVSSTSATSVKKAYKKENAVKRYRLGSSNKNSLDIQPLPTSTTGFCSGGIQNSVIKKTRKLPLWMYEVDNAVYSTNKRSVSSDNETQRKKQKISDEIEAKVETSDIPTSTNAETIDENLTLKANTRAGKNESKKLTKKKKDGIQSSVNDNEENVSRPICQYEGKCYRKNPQHKSKFCHPGDSDYVSYEERPICPYGAACYRKSAPHKVEFRHPGPVPRTCKPSPASFISRGSKGEERPPCMKSNRCRDFSPKHRKKLYHPPRGYVCHFFRGNGRLCDSPLSSDSDYFFDEYGDLGYSDDDWYDDWLDSGASSPPPAKRKRKNVKRDNSDYEDEDEYDLEDPFINDASSDEYVPSDLDLEDEEEED